MNCVFRHGIFLISCWLCIEGTHAQSALLSGGGDASGNGSFSWSLGQADIAVATGTVGSFESGVQHGYPGAMVSVSEMAFHPWRIYPNPFGQTLHLQSDVNGSWTMCSLSGQVLQQGKVNPGLLNLEIAPLAPGVYFFSFIPYGALPQTIPLIRQ
jgi:hypothetical protein